MSINLYLSNTLARDIAKEYKIRVKVHLDWTAGIVYNILHTIIYITVYTQYACNLDRHSLYYIPLTLCEIVIELFVVQALVVGSI